MNQYLNKLSACIDDKLIQYAMYSAKSLYNIEILYHYYLKEYDRIIPKEHYSKVFVNAYRETIKEYEK